jgi:hypothetical protein
MSETKPLGLATGDQGQSLPDAKMPRPLKENNMDEAKNVQQSLIEPSHLNSTVQLSPDQGTTSLLKPLEPSYNDMEKGLLLKSFDEVPERD